MKRIIAITLMFGMISISRSQTFPVTADVLRQTYLLKTDTLQGTCFLIEYNNQEYLLSAKHLFKKNLQNGDSTKITIIRENNLENYTVQYFIHNDSTIDVSVLKLNRAIKVITPFSIQGNVTLGQEIYFLGYPNFNNMQFATSGKFGVLPLVKKGIISGWTFASFYNLYFLDGHNNPGFSGGPALCIDYDTKRTVIFGIISGYFYENKPVKNRRGENEVTHIQENSGIIKCYPTILAKQIIESIK